MENWEEILRMERIVSILCSLIALVTWFITEICFEKIRWTKRKKLITRIAGAVLLVGVFALGYFDVFGKNILESCIAAVIVGFSLTACFLRKPNKKK
ncbi:MAG: hypothetical protein IKW01_05595 [Firmicutes bacterium]|nr:hypothetical protein [Bacillota bacterium]